MIIIAGLGNPGLKYQKNRHNVGFLALDGLAYKFGLEFKHNKQFNAEIAELKNYPKEGDTVLMIKPHTFMNNSGDSIQKLASFYKIHPNDIWIVFDELDLPLGNIKIRKTGGPGTHNGMKSIVSLLGKEFPRFRIGIESRGQTASSFQDTASFVLSDFFGAEKEAVAQTIEKTILAIETALKEGLDQAMNKYNDTQKN